MGAYKDLNTIIGEHLDDAFGDVKRHDGYVSRADAVSGTVEYEPAALGECVLEEDLETLKADILRRMNSAVDEWLKKYGLAPKEGS